MNEKEVSEIRRRFKPDKSNISTIRGCYVNEKREIVSEFSEFLQIMQEDEAEKFLSTLKKTLSGTLGKNLIDIAFSTQQVVESDEHALLMAVRDSKLQDDAAVREFFNRVIQTVQIEDNYLILLAQDSYDVPYRSRNDEGMDDASSEVFSYFLCSICPVKMTKPGLSYFVQSNEFKSRDIDWLVSPPELGFMFPTFDDRSSNIYGALCYSRDTAQAHEEFINTVFGSEAPMPAAAQKANFQYVLGNALAQESSLQVVQAVHQSLSEMIDEHKERKEEQPLKISKSNVRQILSESGVDNEHTEAFEKDFDESFGENAAISPRNLVDKKIEIETEGISITINSEFSDYVETRVIDGRKYIMVNAPNEVLVNGVPINIG